MGKLGFFLRQAAEAADHEASDAEGTDRPRLKSLSEFLEAEARTATEKAGGQYAPIVRVA